MRRRLVLGIEVDFLRVQDGGVGRKAWAAVQGVGSVGVLRLRPSVRLRAFAQDDDSVVRSYNRKATQRCGES